MKSKTAIQVCSIGILVCFFFPLFLWHGFEMTGLNYILSDHIPSYKYVLLLIPFSALFLFWGATDDSKYFVNKNLLSVLPLASLVLISIARFTDNSSNKNFYDKENPFSTMVFGFWLLLFLSLLLILVRDEKKKGYPAF